MLETCFMFNSCFSDLILFAWVHGFVLVLIKFFEDKRLDHSSASRTVFIALIWVKTQLDNPSRQKVVFCVHKYYPNLASSDQWPRVTIDQEVLIFNPLSLIMCQVPHIRRDQMWVHYRLSCGQPDRQTWCSDRQGCQDGYQFLCLSSILVSRANCTKLSAALTPTLSSHQAQYTQHQGPGGTS